MRKRSNTVDSERERLAYSIEEAASLIGLGKSKFYLLVNEGEIATVKIGARRLVLASSLREYLEQAAAA
jgi:excisionase family DNA binding protein